MKKKINLINILILSSIFSTNILAQEISIEEKIEPKEIKEKHVEKEEKKLENANVNTNIQLEQSINSQKNNDSYLMSLAHRKDKDKPIKEATKVINTKEKDKKISANIKDKKNLEEKQKTLTLPDTNIKSDVAKNIVTTSNTNTTVNYSTENTSSLESNNPIIAKYGKIITQKKITNDLIAWVIEKNSKRLVMFSNVNQSIVIAGIAWDTTNNQNLNEQFSSYLNKNTLIPKDSHSNFKNKKLDIPTSILALSKLAGVKEGNANVLDTVYIIFDPRCPYCRQAYYKSRSYIAQGRSIKWIPALVLGDSEEALKQASSILQANTLEQTKILNKVLGEKESLNIKVKESTKQELNTNKQYLFTAAKNSNMQQVGVPMAFFFDKRTGKARMLAGLSEIEVLNEIFKGI